LSSISQSSQSVLDLTFASSLSQDNSLLVSHDVIPGTQDVSSQGEISLMRPQPTNALEVEPAPKELKSDSTLPSPAVSVAMISLKRPQPSSPLEADPAPKELKS